MPTINQWDLKVDTDKVLWGQGADPSVIKMRNPRLADVAKAAFEEGSKLIHPILLYRRIPVASFKHETLFLVDGGILRGPFIEHHLLGADEIVAAVCTVGAELSDYASEVYKSDPTRGLALDGLASAAAEALAEAACQFFGEIADQEGKTTSIALNPGMIGWPVLEGQKQIFSLINPQQIGIYLNPSGFLLPLKSLSLVIGFGKTLKQSGTSCNYCTMHEICRYKEQYAKTHYEDRRVK